MSSASLEVQFSVFYAMHASRFHIKVLPKVTCWILIVMLHLVHTLYIISDIKWALNSTKELLIVEWCNRETRLNLF